MGGNKKIKNTGDQRRRVKLTIGEGEREKRPVAAGFSLRLGRGGEESFEFLVLSS